MRINTVGDVLSHFTCYPAVIKYMEKDDNAFYAKNITLGRGWEAYAEFIDEFGERKVRDFEYDADEDVIYLWIED